MEWKKLCYFIIYSSSIRIRYLY